MSLKTNFHTHTFRCNHAVGDFDDIIQEAIAKGIDVLGFSEHGPLPFDNKLNNRLTVDNLTEYLETGRQKVEQYKDQIKILIGLEVEYFADHHSFYKSLKNDSRIDYLVYGPHFINKDGRLLYTRDNVHSHHDLKVYIDNCMVALSTGLFSFIAHPDIALARFELDEVSNKLSDKLISFCIEKDIPIELNAHGLRHGHGYPRPRFWEQAGKTDVKVLINSDCHDYRQLDDHNMDILRQKAVEFDLNVIDYIK